jgi:multidrug efflux pump subunit AcrA (membrane-fusion protein)
MRQIYFLTVSFTFTLIFFSCKSDIDVFVVKDKQVNEVVYASGELFPEDYYMLKTGNYDRILKIPVKEGDVVNPGDILLVLGSHHDNNQINILNDKVVLAENNINDSSAILTELKYKINLAKQQYEQDKKNAERYKELVKEKAVSESETEKYFLLSEISRVNLSNLQQQYVIKKNEMNDILLETKKHLSDAQQKYEEKVFISPIHGTIYCVNYEEGDNVSVNDFILMVGTLNKYKLELLVDERDINKINIGQKIYFETDIYPEKHFDAVVSHINPILQKESRCFKVEAKVLSDLKMYPQSNIEANIIIKENETTILIPYEFIVSKDSVMLKHQNNAIEKIKVSIGIKSDKWVEIKNGLNVGDVIIKSK